MLLTNVLYHILFFFSIIIAFPQDKFINFKNFGKKNAKNKIFFQKALDKLDFW
jgi:hypothetical protein